MEFDGSGRLCCNEAFEVISKRFIIEEDVRVIIVAIEALKMGGRRARGENM